MSLKQRIFEYIRLKYPDEVRGVELQRLAQEKYFNEKYYSGESASREARRLAVENDMVEKRKDGTLIFYKYKPKKLGVLEQGPKPQYNKWRVVPRKRSEQKTLV